MAQRLAKAGVSRVSVSIDSMDEKIHDEIRGRNHHQRAMEGLKHVQNFNRSIFKYNRRSLQCS